MLSYQQLSTPVSEDDVLADLLKRLTELGFSATSWQSGSVQLTLVRLLAYVFAKITVMVAALVALGFNDTATGDGLTRFSKSVYENTRNPAITAQHNIQLTLAVGSGPYTINTGTLVATDGTSTFRNVNASPATLNSGTSPATILFECETTGPGGNAAVGTITRLQTPLAGVTINNPDPFVRAGVLEESDAVLRLRNSTKWAALSIDMPGDGYKNLALGISPVRRAEVDGSNPRGAGTADVYIAAETTTVGSGVVSAVQAAIDIRKSVTADILVIAATSTTITISGTVFISAALYTSPTVAAIVAAVDAYVNGLPIGGDTLTLTTKGVSLSGIEAAIRGVPGVKNVVLTAPLADITLPAFGIATANTAGLTFQSV